jgi:hypothetical protein
VRVASVSGKEHPRHSSFLTVQRWGGSPIILLRAAQYQRLGFLPPIGRRNTDFSAGLPARLQFGGHNGRTVLPTRRRS